MLLGFDAVSFHYYTHPSGNIWTSKGAATGFPEAEWSSTMEQTLKMDEFLAANKEVMDKNDPEKKIGLYVDEWGTWFDPEPGTEPGFLYQQNSLRDAVVAALNFNIFHKHADRVRMTNIAQIVNVLQAMILTEGDKMILTPTYYAFKMYVPFQEATTLPLTVEGSPQLQQGDDAIPAISASAARGKDGKLYLALVNAHLHEAETVSVDVAGMTVNGANGEVLTAEAMDAHNTFDAPGNIAPSAYSATAANGTLTLDLPAKSLVVVAVE